MMNRTPKEITCNACALFGYDIPEGTRLPLFYKKRVHGWCRGAPGHPAHVEHRDSIRCVWFVEREK